MENQRKFWLKIFAVVLVLIAAVLTAHGSTTAWSQLSGKGKKVAVTAPQVAPNDNMDLQDPVMAAPGSEYGNCRYGFATLKNDHAVWLDNFGAGWHLNFRAYAPAPPNDAEFVPAIGVKQDRDEDGNYLPTYTVSPPLTDASGGLGGYIKINQGALWIVGNEVDRVEVQGDTYPDVYARAYHDIYHFIKERDATAQVAISALVQVSPGRLQYLDLVWDAYLEQYGQSMPVDVWNMHLYILPEKRADGLGTGAHIALGTDPALAILESGGDPAVCPQNNVHCVAEHDDMDIVMQQVHDMRSWMDRHDERNKPLIISEFSILYVFLDYDDPINPTRCYVQDEHGGCFTAERVSNYMLATFDYFESATDPELGYPLDGNRLVQQWLWYASHVSEKATGGSSNLLNATGTAMTPVGETFYNYVAARPLETNLLAAKISNPVARSGGASTVDVPLSVDVINNGNRNAGTAFTVTFYEDAAMEDVIGSATIPGPQAGDRGMMACARRTRTASVTWPDLPAGRHPYWFRIDNYGNVSESNENDNTGSGFVLVDPYQRYFPSLMRR